MLTNLQMLKLTSLYAFVGAFKDFQVSCLAHLGSNESCPCLGNVISVFHVIHTTSFQSCVWPHEGAEANSCPEPAWDLVMVVHIFFTAAAPGHSCADSSRLPPSIPPHIFRGSILGPGFLSWRGGFFMSW